MVNVTPLDVSRNEIIHYLQRRKGKMLFDLRRKKIFVKSVSLKYKPYFSFNVSITFKKALRRAEKTEFTVISSGVGDELGVLGRNETLRLNKAEIPETSIIQDDVSEDVLKESVIRLIRNSITVYYGAKIIDLKISNITKFYRPFWLVEYAEEGKTLKRELIRADQYTFKTSFP
jgi:hypothetical protein